ncbi:EAL domain-containing protein [Ruegeria marina]|uniref:EAL domain, c-di-GMP-specific phosphodiesterase class I (Or its enzymatically inactive variant) n=1 Tax=Ruegeria marina TaxID=639004 RepID=A0A1G6NLH7_9RHOB|nr:EAL domain-containing protein [Ruegeria marina]SDC68035.1 EAL domain, c-di-GMP-specific phosphodiesterase class I (or its enzymatically inactive variant) [Ruegeria marina]
MTSFSKRREKMADLPPGSESPLSAAVSGRDRSAVAMATEAVRHGDCMLAYQPVLQAHPPHAVAFWEGFLRVLDETGRQIPARDFMPQVENTEIGRELDRIALDTGLRALRKKPDIRLSINMSARSIGFHSWMQTLDQHLSRDPALGERLILEINQTSAMAMPELVIDFMDRLQPRGIAFALDDFGDGPIDFNAFRDFFFDAVKIDGRFVRGVSGHRGNQAIVRTLVALAREFEMLVVAESVETEADAGFLVATGVDCLQGFLCGAPSVSPKWDRKPVNPARKANA